MGRIRPSLPSPAIVVAILALVAGVAGTAIAGSGNKGDVSKKQVKQIAKGQAKKQARKHVDRSRSFAKVDAAGNVLSAKGVTGVVKAGPGDYHVSFAKDISACSNVAGLREEGSFPLHGLIATYTPAQNVVRVGTFDREGAHADGSGFNLIVSC